MCSPPPPLPRLSSLLCVSANAEQLDAQVVGPLLLFQVLDFITNSVGGGSSVCVRVCAATVLVGESSRHLWAYLNGRMRHESLPSSSTERRDLAKRPNRRRLSVLDHSLEIISLFWGAKEENDAASLGSPDHTKITCVDNIPRIMFLCLIFFLFIYCQIKFNQTLFKWILPVLCLVRFLLDCFTVWLCCAVASCFLSLKSLLEFSKQTP